MIKFTPQSSMRFEQTAATMHSDQKMPNRDSEALRSPEATCDNFWSSWPLLIASNTPRDGNHFLEGIPYTWISSSPTRALGAHLMRRVAAVTRRRIGFFLSRFQWTSRLHVPTTTQRSARRYAGRCLARSLIYLPILVLAYPPVCDLPTIGDSEEMTSWLRPSDVKFAHSKLVFFK